jgi:hypothetical protein
LLAVVLKDNLDNSLQLALTWTIPYKIYGKLPKDLSKVVGLRTFTAYGNKLSGDLGILSALTSLITLDLHFNQFTSKLPDLSEAG